MVLAAEASRSTLQARHLPKGNFLSQQFYLVEICVFGSVNCGSKSSLLSLEKYADSVSCKEFFVYLTPILTHPFGYATETTLLF